MPHVVILSLSFSEPQGFQLLSMLGLDAETSSIPIITHTTEDLEEFGSHQNDSDNGARREISAVALN
jgi:hypothetical protein